MASARLTDLLGGDAAVNAAAIRDVLAGKTGPFRDIVVLNTAAALIVAGRSDNLAEAAQTAQAAIDSGAAAGALQRLVEVSNAS